MSHVNKKMSTVNQYIKAIADGVDLQCPNGYTKSWFNLSGEGVNAVVACYKNCPTGWYNYGDKCWATCDRVGGTEVSGPIPNYVAGGKYNGGWVSVAGACFGRIYDRGVGTLPNDCDDTDEYFVGLCYPKCDTANGYYHTSWSPRTCSQICPANTVEGGFANCTKINEYGRGWGNKGNGCPSGYTDVGLFCYQWPFGFAGYSCPSNCDQNFRPVNPRIHYYKGCNSSSSDPNLVPQVPCKTLPSPDILDPNTGEQVTDAYYNTKQADRNYEGCEEHASGGSLCYPQCDVGYVPFGTNICTPSCGNLRDDGATCHRDWYDRGIGKVPGKCSDPNRQYESGLCYIPCQPDYVSAVTMCVKRGCPDNNNAITSDWQECTAKSFDNSKNVVPVVPNVADAINQTWDLAAMGENVRTIVLNLGLILGCLLLVVFVFGYNVTLRSKPIQV